MSKSGQTYRVAIIGCGPRGNAAAMNYGFHPRTDVVGICDLVQKSLDEVGDRHGIPASARYSDLEKMIRETKPDIVVISTPADFHYPLAMQVLDLGANIDVEKPH